MAARCLFADYPAVWQLWGKGRIGKILPLRIFMICLRLLLHDIWQVAACACQIFFKYCSDVAVWSRSCASCRRPVYAHCALLAGWVMILRIESLPGAQSCARRAFAAMSRRLQRAAFLSGKLAGHTLHVLFTYFILSSGGTKVLCGFLRRAVPPLQELG